MSFVPDLVSSRVRALVLSSWTNTHTYTQTQSTGTNTKEWTFNSQWFEKFYHCALWEAAVQEIGHYFTRRKRKPSKLNMSAVKTRYTLPPFSLSFCVCVCEKVSTVKLLKKSLMSLSHSDLEIIGFLLSYCSCMRINLLYRKVHECCSL